MTGYIIRRVLTTIPVILIVALVVFAILRLAPGDPAAILAGTGGAEVDPALVEKIRVQLGLDQPLHVQLYRYFSDLARGDLGQSLLSKHEVSDLIRARVVPTISLTIMTEIFALVMAIPLGVLAAWKVDSWIDRLIMVIATLGFSMPVFWLGFLMIFFLRRSAGHLPGRRVQPAIRGHRPVLAQADNAGVRHRRHNHGANN